MYNVFGRKFARLKKEENLLQLGEQKTRSFNF